MNDRYLYRAKRIDNGEWVKGLLTILWGKLLIINHDDENLAYRIDESTICQCTGLRDKNGKLIWENDIIQCNGIITAVSWNKKYASFVLTRKRWLFPHFFGESQDPEECEVIGNIFDEGSENIGKVAEEN